VDAYFKKIRLTDWVIPNVLKNTPTAKSQHICVI
jgi:hypothetical protein